MSAPEIYFRYADYVRGDGTAGVMLREFTVLRRTKCGVWVNDLWENRDRFILDGCYRQFAYSDLEKAKRSFRIRKKRQIERLERQLDRAKQALALAERGFPPEPELPDFVCQFELH